MESHWLSDPEQRAWRRFAAVLEILPAALDSQLSHDEDITHFEYFTLAMLSEADQRTLRMSSLAQRTNATLARLSNVIRRLEGRKFVERHPCPEDRRATNVVLTEGGWEKVVRAAPGHAAKVQSSVFDALTPEQTDQLFGLCGQLLERLDPEHRMFASDEDA